MVAAESSFTFRRMFSLVVQDGNSADRLALEQDDGHCEQQDEQGKPFFHGSRL